MTEANMESRPIPRMRTAAGIVVELKKLDPDTGVTESMIRKFVKTGQLTAVWAGNKALINLNDVLELMSAGTEKPVPESCTVGGIRRLDAWRA